MPGVLIVEAMAQTAGALVVHTLGLEREKRHRLFHDHRKGALPQARAARATCCACRSRRCAAADRSGAFEGQAYVGDMLCAEAEFSAMIHDGADVSDGDSSDRAG